MPLAELPQTNKMHAVPQNIMDVEFKLIGDLTIRQFIYLLFFGGIAYVCSVVLVGIFKWPIVLLNALLGIGLAFVPIQERGLDEWIVNFVKSVYSPTQRIWFRVPTIPSAFMYENLAVVKQELITLAPTSSRRRLEEFLEYQLHDEVVDPLDIPEKEYTQKVRDAYAAMEPQQSVSVGVLEPEVDLQAQYPPAAGMPEPIEPASPPQQQAIVEPEPPKEEVTKPVEQKAVPSYDVTPQAEQPKVEAPPTTSIAPLPIPQQPEKPAIAVQQEQKPTPQVPQMEPEQRPARTEQKPRPHRAYVQPSVSLSPMTPDMHSGRRFINLVPTSGELVLPIRGERVIKTSEELDVEEDIQDKAAKLQQLLQQIKQETGVGRNNEAAPQNATPAVPKPANVDTEAQNLANKLEGEKQRLASEISALESQKNTTSDQSVVQEKDAMIRRLQVEKEKTQSDYESLQKQILDLQNKLKEQKGPDQPKPAVTPKFISSTPQFAGKPNVISGSIKLGDGSAREGILLIMKNQKGEAVRAFKTNSLGQFKLTTPLSNGIYTIEVTSDNFGSTFDIISVEAKGEPIPPIEIIGK